MFGGSERPAMPAAEDGLQITEVGICGGGVVVQDQAQRKFLGELIIQLRAHQMVVENILPGFETRRRAAIAGAEPVIKIRFIKAEARGGAQSEARAHLLHVPKKGRNRWSGKVVLTGAGNEPPTRTQPFFRRRAKYNRRAGFAERNDGKT